MAKKSARRQRAHRTAMEKPNSGEQMDDVNNQAVICEPEEIRGTSCGASPDDWAHFDLVLGLGADLLPVVSNRLSEISESSSLKELGKTPSRYNGAGKVAGILDWANRQASDADIERWSAESDYGICLQTRTVRALDIDVPDPALARAICKAVADIAGYMPCRRRSNSGKCLLAFSLPGEMGKRKMVVEGGIVELLATGQQFVAVGTHPSGARYEWLGGLPTEFPELTPQEFDALWSELAERFAIAPPEDGRLSVRMKGATVLRPDPVADHLHQTDRVLGTSRAGAILVACPWEHEHTTGSKGDGSTVWFPAGTNGYEAGHFKCLHGHCTGRTDGDFFGVIGYAEDMADDFAVVALPSGRPQPLPNFKRDKVGRIEATVENVRIACVRPDLCRIEIRYDQFRDEIMHSAPGTGQWQSFTDSDYTRLRITLERQGFKAVGRELIRDVVLLVAQDQPFDSAQAWLSGLAWDGVSRVERFLVDYFGAQDTPYTRAVSSYLWTALAGRVMEPGCKADMVPILVGGQGVGKSTGVAAMVPANEFFTEVSFHEKDDDLARRMRGRLLGEIGELRGLHTRELESIKAFITRTHESWVPKYREFAVTFPRRIVFVGTTNKDEFLADETGNRRWLPVSVGQGKAEDIRRDRLQLWAEARELFGLVGVQWQDAERLAVEVHEDHTIRDSWDDAVARWLDEVEPLTGHTPRACKFLRIGDVLRGALNLDAKHCGRREELRLGAVLRRLDYQRRKVRDGGKVVWAYVPSVTPLGYGIGNAANPHE